MRIEGRETATAEEQATLAKFVGWGQFPALFNESWGYSADHKQREAVQRSIDPTFNKNDWEDEQALLKSLLSEEEWDSAKGSVLNAHFTHPDVVDAHWKMARKLGFKGGRFLETSAGVGYYLGMMPSDIAAKTKPSAVELESATGTMLKSLYPKANVQIQGFQDFRAPDNFYDMVASNVPFGDYGVYDPRYDKFDANIHDYFFLKSVDLAAPGGLVMHITSTGTLDKPDSKIRKELASKCDLVAAVRFPGGAHKENAGTDVVTDMVILRKRHPGEEPVTEDTPPEAQPAERGFTGITIDALGRLYHWEDGKRVPGPKWEDVTTVPDPDGGDDITVNQYFADNPENILGRLDRSGTMYRGASENVSLASPEELTEALDRPVKVVVGENGKRIFVFEDEEDGRVPPATIREVGAKLYQEKLQGFIDRLPDDIHRPAKNSQEAFSPDVMPAPKDVKEGGYTFQDGKLLQRQGGALVERQVKKDTADRIVGQLGILAATRAVINAQLQGGDAEAARAELNRVYDAYVADYGYLNEKKNRRAMMDAGDDFFLLQALEKWNADQQEAKKSDMFSKDTIRRPPAIEKADSVSDGFAASLHEYGRVDPEYISKLTGQPLEDVQAELVEKGIAFEDPGVGWQPADIYLSGNVRRKLLDAKAAAAADPKFTLNVEALEKVQPEDKDYTEIGAKLGSPWIPPSDYQDFAHYLIGARKYDRPDELFQITHTAQGGWDAKWTAKGRREYGDREQTLQWEVGGQNMMHLLEAAMTGRQVVIKGGLDEYVKDDGTVVEFPAVKTNENGEEIDVVNRKLTNDAAAKIQEMKDEFKNWIWEDDARTQRLTRYYNDNFNNIRDIQYDGSHLTFPGMNPSFNPHPHIPDFVWQVVTTGKGFAGHEVGLGKAQPLDSQILTPRGWIRMGDVTAGDEIIAGDGSRTTVSGVFPQGEREIFRVLFSDGSSTECCEEHLWLTHSYRERNQKINEGRFAKSEWNCARPKVRSLREIRETLIDRGAKNHAIPVVGPVNFYASPVPIDPYTLGALIGDGDLRETPRISNPDDGVISRLSAPTGVSVKEAAVSGGRCRTVSLSRTERKGFGRDREPNPLTVSLKELGLYGKKSHEKFVPECYKINSYAARLATLQGLLDTDGYVDKSGTCVQFCTSSPQLAQDVVFLVQSLGGVARIATKKPFYTYKGQRKAGRLAHILTISLPPDISPFQTESKAERVVPKSKYIPRRYIVSVEPVGRKPAQCISIEHQSRLYVTDDFIVTHNTAAMVMSAMELRRLGLAKKPCIACLKSNIEQITKEAHEIYPGARIISTADMFDANKRKDTIARIATGDYDMVIMTHDHLGMLKMPPEVEAQYIREEIEELETAKRLSEDENPRKDNRVVKALEKAKKKLEVRLKKALDKKQSDDVVYFPETGIDQLFVDECFPGETSIATDHGPMTIADIVDHNRKVQVLSRNLQTHELEYMPVSAWFKRPLRNDVVRVRHEKGSFLCTPNHNIWTLEEGYVQAGLLKSDHALVTQVIRGEMGKQEAPEISRVVSVTLHQRKGDDRTVDGGPGNHFVYDIEVFGNHNYFADGVNVSNSHQFKTLPVYTRLQRIKGIPTGRSNRATDMLMRTRWLMEQNGGRGVVFATGTPVSNTMAELYTWQRYLQPDELKERGIESFDDWANTFGEIETRNEFTVAGDYKPTTRFSSFTNVGNLMNITRQMLDVQKADNLRRSDGSPIINRPKRRDKAIVSPKSQAIENLMTSLSQRAAEIAKKTGPPQKGDDNMLVICTDGRKGALDMRLLDDSAPDDPNSKTNKCVNQVLQLHKERPDQCQLIFSDLGVNPVKQKKSASENTTENEDVDNLNMGSSGGFRLYDDIINKLVAGGIPREQIADFSRLDGVEKDAAQAAMRRGEIKIGIGSTQRLGTGTNVQTRLMALHHLDVPWTPASVEQRDGRGYRHGNTNTDVGIYRYITEGSLDQKFWSIVATKKRFIDQVITTADQKLNEVREEDTDTLSPEHLMAIASGDERVLEKVDLEDDVKRLQAAARRHERQQKKLTRAVASHAAQRESQQERVAAFETDIKHLEATPRFRFQIGDQLFSDRSKTSEALSSQALAVDARWEKKHSGRYYRPTERTPVGEYRGMAVSRENSTKGSVYILEGPSGEEYRTADSLQSIEYVARGLARKRQDLIEELKKAEEDIAGIHAKIGEPFRQAEELNERKARLRELEEALSKKTQVPKENVKRVQRTLFALRRAIQGGDLVAAAHWTRLCLDNGATPYQLRAAGLSLPKEVLPGLEMLDSIKVRRPSKRNGVRLSSDCYSGTARVLDRLAASLEKRAVRMGWSPYKGPQGGRGWKNAATGEVRYQADKPDEPFSLKSAPAKARTSFESVRGKQKSLFQKSGLPGQMNLFDDTGVPDDLVAKSKTDESSKIKTNLSDEQHEELGEWLSGNADPFAPPLKAAGVSAEQPLTLDDRNLILLEAGYLGDDKVEKALGDLLGVEDVPAGRYVRGVARVLRTQSTEARRKTALEKAGKSEAVIFSHPDGRKLILHPATRKDRTSKWQLTSISRDGQPFGHTNPKTFKDGLFNALGIGEDSYWNEHGYEIEATSGKRMALYLKRIRRAKRLAVAHAPAGGITIQGQEFAGGQFIPSDVMEKASPDERKKLEGKDDPEKPSGPTEDAPSEIKIFGNQKIDVMQREGQWFFRRARMPGWARAVGAMEKLIEAEAAKGPLPAKVVKPRGRKPKAKPKKPEAAEKSTRRTGPAIVHLDKISVDAPRFQYKIEGIGSEGVGAQFSDVKFNPELAGILYVWHDPKNDKTYVVNGHHRYELAKRSGWSGELPVHFIDRETPEEARAFGALINIAQGAGTALDAAKFMRDMGFTGAEGLDYFKDHNISLKGRIASDALKLANLSDQLFRSLVYGQIEPGHAMAIGEELSPQPGDSDEARTAIFDAQNKLFGRMQKAKGRLSEAVVREMALNAGLAPRVAKEGGQKGLFDTGEEEEILFEDLAKVQAAIRDALTKDVRGFGAVASQSREELLRKTGVGDVSATAAGERKQRAETMRDAFDREIRFRGDLSRKLNDLLNGSAKDYRNAKGKREKREVLKRAIGRTRTLLAPVSETGSGDVGRVDGGSSGDREREPSVAIGLGTQRRLKMPREFENVPRAGCNEVVPRPGDSQSFLARWRRYQLVRRLDNYERTYMLAMAQNPGLAVQRAHDRGMRAADLTPDLLKEARAAAGKPITVRPGIFYPRGSATERAPDPNRTKGPPIHPRAARCVRQAIVALKHGDKVLAAQLLTKARRNGATRAQIEGVGIRCKSRAARLAEAWARYEGPKGGQGWKNSTTGEIRYQREKPSAAEATTQAEVNAVQDYTTDKFQTINRQLRSGEVDAASQKIVSQVDSYLAKQPPYDGPTFRQFSIPNDEIRSALKVGGVIGDKAFVSTRKRPNLSIANAFRHKTVPKDNVVFRIDGAGGVDVSHLSMNPGEDEVLWARGTTFQINKIHRTSTGGYVAMVTPSPPAHRLAAQRSPVGGISIAGNFYPGGQFIPSAVVDKASKSERKALQERQAAAGKPIEIHDPITGEIYWRGAEVEGRQMLKEQAEIDPRHGLEIREATDLELGIRHLLEEEKLEEEPPTPTLPPPSDYKSFRTGTPLKATAYRGQSRGGGGLAALGAGKYYGLEPKVAERFSKKGTVEARTIELKKPIVIHNDDQMRAIKQKAEKATGRDFGRKGNLYEGWLLPEQSGPFADYLRSQGYDGIVTTYPQAPGGEQIVTLSPVRRMSVTHAPEGGVSIGGQFYPGGQFIPKDVIAQATKKERQALKDSPETFDQSRAPIVGNYSRRELPQLSGRHKPEFLESLAEKGIGWKKVDISAKKMKGIQQEFNADKVAHLAEVIRQTGRSAGSPLLASSDGTIIDGHHRWRGQLEADPDGTLEVFAIDLPIDKLVQELLEYPKAFRADVSEAAGPRSKLELFDGSDAKVDHTVFRDVVGRPRETLSGEKAQKAVASRTKAVFGEVLDERQLASAVGAPPGSTVKVYVNDTSNGSIDIEVNGKGWAALRQFRATSDRFGNVRRTCSNLRLEVAEDSDVSGTQIFASQVRALGKLGVDVIHCEAWRDDGAQSNGYYTWARLGYVPMYGDPIGKPPEEHADKIRSLRQENGPHSRAANLTELMSTKEGREWWKENGWTWNAEFDLKPDSLSRRVLDAYIAAGGGSRQRTR